MIGISMAYHAHNQFMQSLSAAGAIGVIGMVTFTLTLGIYAWRAAGASSGLSLALFSFVFLRGVTEVPYAIRGITNNEYFFLIVLFAVCIAYQPDSTRNHRIGINRPKAGNRNPIASAI